MENKNEKLKINWFPGHMTGANRKIEKILKLVDCVAELVDARIPISSRNPDLNNLLKGKRKLIVLTKCDMADSNETKKWVNYYKKIGIPSIQVDAKNGKGIKNFAPAIKSLMKDKTLHDKQKGIENRTIRVIVAGIPNVGKSSFINKMFKGNRAKVENRPGVTQTNQWFTVAKGLEILDTPGILWPKLDSKYDFSGENLAFTGAVRDQVSDITQLAIRFLEVIADLYPTKIMKRYRLEDFSVNSDMHDVLDKIARKRGMLISGGSVDLQRVSEMLFNEFRAGKLGEITLERVSMISE